jgi:hypothetical protein
MVHFIWPISKLTTSSEIRGDISIWPGLINGYTLIKIDRLFKKFLLCITLTVLSGIIIGDVLLYIVLREIQR